MQLLQTRRRRWSTSAAIAAVLTVAPAVGIVSSAAAARTTAPHLSACAPGTTVSTVAGSLCGTTDGDGVNEWRGVPYAQPPTGIRRWTPPQPSRPWSGVRAATTFGAECSQLDATGGIAGSEDCLYLNVAAPAALRGSSRPSRAVPVIVNLHPGGFYAGSGNGDFATLAASGPHVVVSLNYRLSVFGFLADRSFGTGAGDWGLLDQQAALRWVQRNIGAFGGDSTRVTLMGESAGAESVCHQLASPSAKGLFQRAVSYSGFSNNVQNRSADEAFPLTKLESQDCKVGLPNATTAGAESRDFARVAGCGATSDVAACLRALPARRLLELAGSGYQFRGGHGTVAPTLGTPVLPITFSEAIDGETVNRVPTIFGVARDEQLAGQPTTEAAYSALVRAQYGSTAGAVLREYPVRRFVSPFVAWRTVAADSNSVCPMMSTSQRLAGLTTVHSFVMSDENAVRPQFAPEGLPAGSPHITDWYLLEVAGIFPPPDTPDLVALQQQELAEISAFAATGTTATVAAPDWPRRNTSGRGDGVMVFAPGAGSQVLPDEAVRSVHHCGFWDAQT